ncbi:hypothetical protein [Plantactinospora endophytica]|uniref:Metal transporter n=1 Tax=Plantactinospora endophytica TaxID=673535 RepID=A0ABQ4DYR9_9ACTN|nr:hypothetical protein [Plantactinospora endophytica]GIG87585.1 hypothetical protein Pen02_25210 [Plantactinospora endophytica]
MDHTEHPAGPGRVLVDVGLGVLSAAGSAGTAYLLATSWGGAYWVFGCAVGVVVTVLALSRARRRSWPVFTALVVAGLAVGLAGLADLPQEPGPVTALALAVLTGSALRTLPAPRAAAVAVAGFGVVAGSWLSAGPGFTAVTVWNLAGWIAAVLTGLGLRAAGTHTTEGERADPIHR